MTTLTSKIFCCHTYTYNNCQWRRTQNANVKYFPEEKKRSDLNLKSWMAESTIRVLVSLVYTKSTQSDNETRTLTHVAQRQSQLHLQQTRPHCVFSLFSFCHCLASTCSIIVTLTSSVSPSWPELSHSFSGSARFLLSIVNWMYAILIKLLITPCLFPVFNSKALSYAYSSHWQGLATISSACETIVAIARFFPVWSPFLSVCLSHLAGCALSFLSVCTIGGIRQKRNICTVVHAVNVHYTRRSKFYNGIISGSNRKQVTNGSIQKDTSEVV